MTSIASKTRERLLDVARQLFASNGVEHTTMHDIAAASDKGRRTIYTYFKNKKEIYDAVIEREADRIVEKFAAIVDSDLPPVEKLEAYIRQRFQVLDDTVKASATSQLISYLTLDSRRLERIRRLAVEKEHKLLRLMIDRGVEAGVFDPVQAAAFPSIYQVFFQGADYSHLHDNYLSIGIDPATFRDDAVAFITRTLTGPSTSTPPPLPAES